MGKADFRLEVLYVKTKSVRGQGLAREGKEEEDESSKDILLSFH